MTGHQPPLAPPIGLRSSNDESLWNFSTTAKPGGITPDTIDSNTTQLTPCAWILYSEIAGSRVRVWDVIIIIPNTIFLLFLLLRLRTAIPKLRCTNSPIFLAFYGLVCVVAMISVLRCVVSMTVNAAVTAGDVTDKVLWLVLRFFLISTEMSVVIFGLAFGHLDSKTSIRRVLLVTSFTALAYSCIQGALEFKYPDDTFHVKNSSHEYDIFGHGGMLFLCASSLFFFLIYIIICILPFTRLRDRLPSKKSFYYYCAFLTCLNFAQAVGSGLLYGQYDNGLCVVDVTAYLYFTLFAPLVYVTFLREFFASSQPPTILFSYKVQVDDTLDDDNSVSLPHQIYSQSKLEADLNPGSYDSTHFDLSGSPGMAGAIMRPGSSPNPLYRQQGMFHSEMQLPVAAGDSLYSDSEIDSPVHSAGPSPLSSPDEYAYKPDKEPYTM